MKLHLKRMMAIAAIQGWTFMLAPAAERRWDGGGADNLWETPRNWTGDQKPTRFDDAIFDSTSSKDCQATAGVTEIHNLMITSGYGGSIDILDSRMSIFGDFVQEAGSLNWGDSGHNFQGNFTKTGGESIGGNFCFENTTEKNLQVTGGEFAIQRLVIATDSVLNAQATMTIDTLEIRGVLRLQSGRFIINDTSPVSLLLVSSLSVLDIADGVMVDMRRAGGIINSGTINQIGTGRLRFGASALALTDSNGSPLNFITPGSPVFVSLIDEDENIVGTARDGAEVMVTSMLAGDAEVIPLLETENFSELFTNTNGFPTQLGSAQPGNGVLEGQTGDIYAIAYRDDEDPDDALSLTINATDIDVMPLSELFGVREINTGPGAVRTITITNRGTEPLNFTGMGIELTGSDAVEFSIVNAPSIDPLENGSSLSVDVVFDPVSRGPKSASVLITTDDLDEPIVPVALAGIGATRPIVIDVVLNDENDDQVVNSGETLTVILDQPVTIDAGLLSAGSFFLPVDGDSLGGLGFDLSLGSANARQLAITLGQGAALTIPGDFDPGATGGGSPSGFDLAAGLPAGAIVSLLGLQAVPRADSGVDAQFTLESDGGQFDADGGVLVVQPSLDAAYTDHALELPAGALSGSATIRLEPPVENLGLAGAVQVRADSPGLTFNTPVRLTLQYRDSDLDPDQGQSEASMRAHQLVQVGPGVIELIPIDGEQMLDTENNTVTVEINNLNPQGSVGDVGIFANLPIETIKFKITHIKPGANGAGRGIATTIMGDEGSVYGRTRVEFPGFVETTPGDPDAVRVQLRSANPIIYNANRIGRPFPSAKNQTLLEVRTFDARLQPIAFDQPADIFMEFRDGTLEGQTNIDDRVTFDGEARPTDNMRLVWDAVDGPEIAFEFFAPEVAPPITSFAGGGTLMATGVTTLTDSSGVGYWGVLALAEAPPKNRAAHWELYP